MELRVPKFASRMAPTSTTIPKLTVPKCVTPRSIVPPPSTTQSTTTQSTTTQSTTEATTPRRKFTIVPVINPKSITPKSVNPKSITPKSINVNPVNQKVVAPMTPPNLSSYKKPVITKPFLTPRGLSSSPIIPKFAQSPRIQPFTPNRKAPQIIHNGETYRWSDESIWEEGKITPFTQVVSLTPIGSMVSVPTKKIKPPLTRRLCHQEETEDVNPIAHATMYIDTSDTTYITVADKMKSITRQTLYNRHLHYNVLMKLPNIQPGKVTKRKFDELLSVYENNQVYYQDEFDANHLTQDEFAAALTSLEYWFILYIEPKVQGETQAVIERERFKLTHGYSAFCDKTLYSYITPAPQALRDQIMALQAGTY